MATKRLLRDFLLFTRKDRLAVATLLVLIALAWCLPYLFVSRQGPDISAAGGWTKLADSLLEPGPTASATGPGQYMDGKKGDNRYTNSEGGKLFRFDPNTLDEPGWRELGLRDRTIETILKYRSRGGSFREPADLGKIYGLPPGLRDKLLPYVQIASPPRAGSYPAARKNFRPDFPATRSGSAPPAWNPQVPRTYPATKRRVPAMVDLNRTDTSALIALPCIGAKLATRILQFRDRLGGFHSVEQLREVYGISDSAFMVIRPFLQADPADCRLIAINEVSLDELKQHPYLRVELARTIISYRQEHGDFRELADLRKLTALPGMTYEKIRPYLRL